MKKISIRELTIGANAPCALIAGPCVIESENMARSIAGYLKDITGKLEIPFIFKASYDKANRTSKDSYRGPGMERGLDILDRYVQNMTFLCFQMCIALRRSARLHRYSTYFRCRPSSAGRQISSWKWLARGV
jgi:3-deoxy-D-arabino-heptulosonate 7-phosphate (DAHP) synthase